MIPAPDIVLLGLYAAIGACLFLIFRGAEPEELLWQRLVLAATWPIGLCAAVLMALGEWLAERR